MSRLTRLLLLLGLVIAGGLVPGSGAHAAGVPSRVQREMRSALIAPHWRSNALSRIVTSSLQRHTSPRLGIFHEADTQAPARLSATDLQLPASAFSGATISQSQTMTPSSSPFAVFHSKGYVGAVGAYVQIAGASLSTSGTLDILLSYQGTLYTDAAAASASYQDVLAAANATTSAPTDCSSYYNGHPCFVVGVNTTTTQWGATVAVLSAGQVNQCTVESLTAVPANLVTANQSTISASAAALFDAGMKNAENVCTASGGTPGPTVTPTPTLPTTLAGIVIVPNGAQDTSTVLTHAKKGTKVEIVMGIENARQGDTATIVLTVKRSGKTLKKLNGSDTFSGSGTIGLVATYTLPKKAGTIKITATVAVDGSSQQKSTKFKVTKT